MFDVGNPPDAQMPVRPNVGAQKTVVDLESELSSTSSQPSLENLVPDMLNSSFKTLHQLASMSNQDKLIYPNWFICYINLFMDTNYIWK